MSKETKPEPGGRNVSRRLMVFGAVLPVAAALALCDQGDPSSLKPYQQALLRDYPDGTSALGRVCFDTEEGASDREAQALWVLGVKSLANFMYDFCKVIFDELIASYPAFILGYWGRSMCNAQANAAALRSNLLGSPEPICFAPDFHSSFGAPRTLSPAT
eukprot:1983758-Prymnesium_polylepis.1